MRGTFVTFEGCDGSGKTTQLGLLREALMARGVEVLITREPGGTEFGEVVRNILLDPHGPDRTILAELFLYSAARAEIVHRVIRPALMAGRVVLAERFTDSTIVYQGYAGGISLESIEKVNRIATGGISPDLTFVLDVCDPQVFDERLAPKQKDKIESRDDSYHSRVREGYRTLALAYPERMRLIDATLPRDRILSLVMAEVQKEFHRKKEGETL